MGFEIERCGIDPKTLGCGADCFEIRAQAAMHVPGNPDSLRGSELCDDVEGLFRQAGHVFEERGIGGLRSG
jgi:hypothetical protein